MRIYLTGGTGLLGSHFAKLAIAEGANVVALARPASDTSHLSLLAPTCASQARVARVLSQPADALGLAQPCGPTIHRRSCSWGLRSASPRLRWRASLARPWLSWSIPHCSFPAASHTKMPNFGELASSRTRGASGCRCRDRLSIGQCRLRQRDCSSAFASTPFCGVSLSVLRMAAAARGAAKWVGTSHATVHF